MKYKCTRCERACHEHDIMIKAGVVCCTDCSQEFEGQVLITGSMSVKNLRRYPSFFNADGSPKKIRCYDNGGETLDRYTVVFTGNYRKKASGQLLYLGMSEDPYHSFGQHVESSEQIDRPSYSHLGKKIRFEDLSKDAKYWVVKEYMDLWEFWDEG